MSIKPLLRSVSSVALLAAAIGLIFLAAPRLALTQWQRFTDPFGDVPPFSQVVFHVDPGNAQVVYGAGLDVRVTTEGAPVERVDLILETESAGSPEALPMFPEPGNEWRASIASITSPARYFVRASTGRSAQFRITVLTIPRLENVRFRITPPAYTNRAPYEGPLPQGGLSGLPGTRIQVWARSNRPLRGGTLDLVGSRSRASVPLTPTGPDSQEATGDFAIQEPGKLRVRVIDADDQPSDDAYVVPIIMLTDEYPFIRLIEPRGISFATPTAGLPVTFAADDDYGISRIQLFRSLNDSRAAPMEVPVPAPPRTQWSQTIMLPLSAYRLEAGDEIKLFGRVEDNDPAGPKGSESAIAVVRIISQEEYERMLLVRQGMEVFLAKYRHAQRRLEALREDADTLRKKLTDRSSDPKSEKETRAELKKLSQRFRDEADLLRKGAQNKLPYDLDQALSRQMEEMAGQLERLSRSAQALADQSELTQEQIAKALDQLLEKLDRERNELEREAVEPLEHLASIVPLLEDASRFVILVQRQQALADRLQSLKGQDRPENAAVKNRMRDLQREQQEIREALAKLLEDMEDHIARLPEDPKLDPLRKAVEAFVQDVRGRGASDAMADAEAGLGEFNGTRGHASARKAADILEKLLDQVEGMNGLISLGRGGLRFKPTLSKNLGNTVDQLLREAGLLPGKGQGAAGGSSSSRNTLDNIGLYGRLPGLDESAFNGSSRGNRLGDGAASSGETSDRRGAPGKEPTSKGNVGGSADTAVPAPYRRRVSEYFQRIADETGGK